MACDVAASPQIAVCADRVEKSFVAGIPGCRARVGALRGATLTVRQGENVVIVGRAGAGKTTLLLCMAGLVRADAGIVQWFGARIPDYARMAYARTLTQAHEAEERLTAHASGILLLDLALHELSGAHGRALERLATRVNERGSAAVLSSREVPMLRRLNLRGARLERGVIHDLHDGTEAGHGLPVRVAEERVVVG